MNSFLKVLKMEDRKKCSTKSGVKSKGGKWRTGKWRTSGPHFPVLHFPLVLSEK